MVPNSGPWSLLRWSLSYIIKLALILWWTLPTGPAVPCPESPDASIYAWLPEIIFQNNPNPSGLPALHIKFFVLQTWSCLSSPKPMLLSASELPLDYSNKSVGIVYINLSGVIDAIILASVFWPVIMGWKVHVVPIQVSINLMVSFAFWPAVSLVPENNGSANQSWFPEIFQSTLKLVT
ncbi:hypothetical protein DSO57_1012756 [Entomophthora muscae]|uniref:Uncharacterized protein n=1 Tax=Entomophthora muscae TaxID=34485 RepID=A0ACC2SVK1_9FUNG|nr:hypothetical protein DSO57_1012756 [Entomophthora muscae]